MKQFGIILAFELKHYLKNKIFVGITALLVVIIAGVMFFPRVSDAFFGEEESGTESDAVSEGMLLLLAEGVEDRETLRQAFQEAFAQYEVCLADGEEEEVKKSVVSGKAACAFVLDGLDSYTYYVENLSLYDANPQVADDVLKSCYYMNAMAKMGMTAEQAKEVLAVEISHEEKSLGKDQSQNFFYTYIMIFALYMVILLYGQMVASNVATEKSSRAMELLITSAKPVSMMFGKVIASCLAGFLQLVAVFGSSVLFYHLNKPYWEGNFMIASAFGMPPVLLVYMLIFFVLGFLIYAFLFGAIGSTVSKLEDINTAVMPLTLLFVGGFMVVIFSMSSSNVDNIWLRICSYVPLTSPMAMFTRIAMSTVPFYEVAVSIAVLVVSLLAVGVVAAKIYRVGVLLYGTKPSPAAIFKAMKKA